MRVALIVNPVAGRGRSLRAADRALPVLTAAGWQVETRLTAGPGDCEDLARAAAGEGFGAVLVCGGDGSLSQAVRGLLDTDVPCGVIPAGTGNDFSRALGLSRRPELAAAQLVHGHPGRLDLLQTHDASVYSINVMGLGFDARVCERINRRRRLVTGKPAYLAAVALELVSYRPVEVSLRVDAHRWEGRIMLLAIANATTYGAGMIISPRSRVDDGLLDVVLVEHMPRAEFIRSFHQVFRGTHLQHPAVRTWRGHEVEVLTAEPCPVLADGDLATTTPLHVRLCPRRVRVWLPGPVPGMTPAPAVHVWDKRVELRAPEGGQAMPCVPPQATAPPLIQEARPYPAPGDG